MLSEVYITIIIISVAFFLLGLLFLGVKNFAVGMTFLGLAMIMFFALGFASMDIEQKHCENQITSTSTVNGTTTYTNHIYCTTSNTPNEGLAYLFNGIGFLCAIFLISAMFDPIKKQ